MRQVQQKTHISSHGKRMYELSIYSHPDLTDHRDAPAIVGKKISVVVATRFQGPLVKMS